MRKEPQRCANTHASGSLRDHGACVRRVAIIDVALGMRACPNSATPPSPTYRTTFYDMHERVEGCRLPSYVRAIVQYR